MPKYKKILMMKLPYCVHPDLLQDYGISDSPFQFEQKKKRYHDKKNNTPFRPIPSLALATLAAFFNEKKQIDYQLQVIDLNIEGYTRPEVPIDISSYSLLLEQNIKEASYDVLALSVMFIFNVRWVRDAVKLSKKYHPDAKILLGGGYPTIFPERSLTDHDVDAVVIGEGEATLLHLINMFNDCHDEKLENQFPFEGYGIKDHRGAISIIPRKSGFLELDALPMPDWDQLNVAKYFKASGNLSLPLEASRGCPYNCTFCCTNIFWGRRLRYKSVDKLLSEIKKLKEKYHVPAVALIDDNFTFSKKWVTEFYTKYIDAQLSLELVPPNVSVKHLDEEIIDLMVKAGTKNLTFAIETGSKEMQKRTNKNIDFNRVREVVDILKQKDLPFDILWMVGFPNETMAQMQETFDFVRKSRAFWHHFSIVMPYPGTVMYDEARKNDLLLFDTDNLENYDRRMTESIKSTEWTYEDIKKMVYDINIEMNFLNNPYLDTPNHREHLLLFLKSLIKHSSDHVIAHIVIGYISKLKNDMHQYRANYNNALRLLRDEDVANVFNKYLEWDNHIIDDFNTFRAKKSVK